jgi:hypothetical protein
MSITEAAFSLSAVSPEATAPWWAIPVAAAIGMIMALTGIRADWDRWRTRDALVSWRVRGLRNVVSRIAVASVVLIALTLPTQGTVGSAKAPLLFSAVVGGLLLFAALEGTAFRLRRKEERWDEVLLRERGLPVRPRQLSWRAAAWLYFFGGYMGLVAISPILSVPLTLIDDVTTQEAVAVLVAFALALGWLVLAAWLTIRQFVRQRRSDREYWPEYRCALREAERPRGGL